MSFTLPLPNSVTPDNPVCVISSFNVLSYYNSIYPHKDEVDDEVKKQFKTDIKSLGWDSIRWSGQQCILTNKFKNNPSDTLSYTTDGKLKVNIDENEVYINLNYDYDSTLIQNLKPYFTSSLIDNILNLKKNFDDINNHYYMCDVHVYSNFLSKRKNKIYIHANLLDTGVLEFHTSYINLPQCVYIIEYDFVKNIITIEIKTIICNDFQMLKIYEAEIEKIFSDSLTGNSITLDEIVSDKDKMYNFIENLTISHKHGIDELGKLIINKITELDSEDLIELFQYNY